MIASSGEVRITGNGQIFATPSPHGNAYSGGGSGGAVRLVANRITMAGQIYAYGLRSNHGIIRFEAPAGMLSYSGGTNPEPILSSINPSLVAPASPDLRIVSVGGFAVPTSAGARKDAADLVLPKQLPDPINVVVAASNIPVGSPVTVSFGTGNQGTAPAVPLTGTLANSSATIGVSGLDRNYLAYLYVQVIFAPSGSGASAAAPSGEVAQVRMSSTPGRAPQFAFLRSDGSVVPSHRVPPHMKAWISKPSSR